MKTLLQEPWTVAILKDERKKLHCSGSIITDRHILTAAHCFPSSIDKKSLSIVAGVVKPTDNEKRIKIRKGEILKIKDVKIHNAFNSKAK